MYWKGYYILEGIELNVGFNYIHYLSWQRRTTMLDKINEAYENTFGSYKEKIDAAFKMYLREGVPAMSQLEFWEHVAKIMADNADSLYKQMKREHEHFLAYKFELDAKEKELNFTHKSPQEIFQQWEDQKEKARQKNDQNRRKI